MEGRNVTNNEVRLEYLKLYSLVLWSLLLWRFSIMSLVESENE
jgi:hypothetical protein